MNPIAESELIINDRGAIYHINCRPEEIADTIIIVGDPGRVKEVSKYFDTIEYENQHREFIVHTGFIGHKRLTCLSTGIGPDNIDIVLNELDALVNIDFETRTIKEKSIMSGLVIPPKPKRLSSTATEAEKQQREMLMTERNQSGVKMHRTTENAREVRSDQKKR